jgi:hypothetical protein
MRTAAILLAASLSMTACVSSDDFYAEPYDLVFDDARPYQEVYATTLSTMRRCGYASGPADFLGTAALNLDAQLYGELGYGEIEWYMSGVTIMRQMLTRIERRGTGSRVSIRMANMANEAPSLARMEHWTRGGTDCLS